MENGSICWRFLTNILLSLNYYLWNKNMNIYLLDGLDPNCCSENEQKKNTIKSDDLLYCLQQIQNIMNIEKDY